MKKFIKEKIFRIKPKKKTGFKFIEVIIIMLITITLGMIVGGSVVYLSPHYSYKEECIDESLFDDHLKKIINTYNSITSDYFEDVDQEELADSAIKSMLQSLGDAHTIYMDIEETESFNERMQGDYYGMGAEITVHDSGYIRVLTVFEDSPAEEAGVQEFDLIKAVNGESVKGWDPAEVADKLKGPEGTDVNVTFEREGEEIDKVITRRQVVLSSVSEEIYKEGNKNVGYIKIDLFSNNTYDQFRESLLKIENKGIDSLIIDVRNNSGGYLHRVSEIVSMFLEKDKIIYQLEDKDNLEKIHSYTKESRDYPIAVLINEYSASASEILAAALNESYGAVVVGVNSVGKGTVQQTKELEGGGMLKYTIQKWLTPEGNWINNKGITPDVEIEQEEEYYQSPIFENDSQFKRAIEEIIK